MEHIPLNEIPSAVGGTQFAADLLVDLIEGLVAHRVVSKEVMADILGRRLVVMQRQPPETFSAHPAVKEAYLDQLTFLIECVLKIPDAPPRAPWPPPGHR